MHSARPLLSDTPPDTPYAAVTNKKRVAYATRFHTADTAADNKERNIKI